MELLLASTHSYDIATYVYMPKGNRNGDPTFLTGLSPNGITAGNGVSLGALRERVMEDMALGGRFVLVSASPRIAYPLVPGSSLLEDAKFLAGPLAPEPADRDKSPELVLPECLERETTLSTVLETALYELGLELCASLDHALFEALLDTNELFSTLSAREIEGLRGASLVRMSEIGPQWTMPKRVNELKRALSAVLADQTNTQEAIAAVFAGLWTIERTIRRALRLRAIDLWGEKWRRQILAGDLTPKVEGRAMTSAYAAATGVSQIRDPLEWLTMGELLETRARTVIGNLGLEDPLWRTLANEVLPVRNQISHMRLIRPSDLGTVLKWVKVVQLKLR
ncbi:hypothetical protein [Lacisediminihabitans sp. H27-G8]|uniref:hypothetical protein n=1 Tax=Lacisediminihabitans sp. H27-G8 TaxID=3111909 RepID=UPI0038FC8472